MGLINKWFSLYPIENRKPIKVVSIIKCAESQKDMLELTLCQAPCKPPWKYSDEEHKNASCPWETEGIEDIPRYSQSFWKVNWTVILLRPRGRELESGRNMLPR